MANVDEIPMQEDMQFNTLQDDILYMVLTNSKLANELTGAIRKSQKPLRNQPPKVEDCIISSLSIEAGSVQFGTSNVNIYVPDIPACTTHPSEPADTEAATARIKQLAGLAYAALKSHYCENGWSFECVAQDVIEEAALHCHRIWLKVRFNFHNS